MCTKIPDSPAFDNLLVDRSGDKILFSWSSDAVNNPMTDENEPAVLALLMSCDQGDHGALSDLEGRRGSSHEQRLE